MVLEVVEVADLVLTFVAFNGDFACLSRKNHHRMIYGTAVLWLKILSFQLSHDFEIFLSYQEADLPLCASGSRALHKLLLDGHRKVEGGRDELESGWLRLECDWPVLGRHSINLMYLFNIDHLVRQLHEFHLLLHLFLFSLCCRNFRLLF